MNNDYTFPKDFDPYYAIYALKGLADLVHGYHTEGPGISLTPPPGSHEMMIGVSWLAKRTANELTDYLAALDDAGISLPFKEEDFERYEGMVKEPTAVYGTYGVIRRGNTASD